MHWKNKLASRENHWNWKGGSKIYREILMTVTSNELVCALCGIEEKRVLVAHHIDHNRKNNEVSNLIWLCMNCHYLVHHDEKLNFKIQNRNPSRLGDHCPLIRSNLVGKGKCDVEGEGGNYNPNGFDLNQAILEDT